jgi:RNA polymerase sigma-70 factor (ECF subfamily)
MEILTNFSDQELISSYLDGNTDAVSILVNRHKDKIFTSIYLLVKDKYLAEDLFQDTFFKVIDTFQNGKYKEEGKFLPWAVRIAHNLCIDHFRKTKRTASIQISENEDFQDMLSLSEKGADEHMIEHQSHSALRKLIATLPEEQQEVIILRHYADMTFKEIATMTNCSINTALGRMRYGLLNLRKMMAVDIPLQHS